MANPFLIDGLKFDFRLYVLVTSCDPIRIYLFKDGLARFATDTYIDPNSKNCANTFQHLTNYSINKYSEKFIGDNNSKKSHKRSIREIYKYFALKALNVRKLKRDIHQLIVKTIICAQPHLAHQYRMQ